MPFGEKVECSKCHKNESFMWHQVGKTVECSECHESTKVQPVKSVEEEVKPPAPVEKLKPPVKKTMKPVRSYKTRQNPNATPKQPSTKGKGRRHIFKKNAPTKLTPVASTITTKTSVMLKGQLFKIGDIISVRDVDGGIYYAQIQGLMQDQYCELSATITWLLPTKTNSPFARKGFDPLTYVLGPRETLPRKLECMEFVMSCPADYFHPSNPFPIVNPDPNKGAGFIWGRCRPK